MSDAFASPLRTLAFGALDSGLWAVAWAAGPQPVAIVGAIGHEQTTAGGVIADTFSGDTLRAGGLDIRVETLHECTLMAHDPGAGDDDAGEELLSARICRVTGEQADAGGAQPVDCVGIEVIQEAPVPAGLDSFRQVLAWFAEDDALTVSSERPRKAGGQDKDEVVSAMFVQGQPLPVDETRLSTTYAAGGPPTRTTLELWTIDDETDIPWRAAGEVVADGASVTAAGFVLQAYPMRCHRAGRDGLGVYLLARPA